MNRDSKNRVESIAKVKIKFTTTTGRRFAFVSINSRDIILPILTPTPEGTKAMTIENYTLPASEKVIRISGLLMGEINKSADISIEVIPPRGIKVPKVFTHSYFFSNGGRFVFVAEFPLQALETEFIGSRTR